MEWGQYIKKFAFSNKIPEMLHSLWLRNIPRCLIICAIFFSSFLIVSSISNKNPHEVMLNNPVIPVTSYVHLTLMGQVISIEVLCDPDDTECVTPDPEYRRLSSSSSVKISGNRLLTAGHVCEAALGAAGRTGSMDPNGDFLVSVALIATDYKNEMHVANVEAIHASSDLCILSVRDVQGEIAEISDNPPIVTERIWNISSPHGIFTPGSPLIFDGIYAGRVSRLDSDQYTVPAAPGSSGSPVFRSDGSLVGILHSVNENFDHAAYSATLESIREIESVTR